MMTEKKPRFDRTVWLGWKVGTDIFDQTVGFYIAFNYVLDTSSKDGSIVYALNNQSNPQIKNAFYIGLQMPEAIVLPYITARPIGLQSTILYKKALLLEC